MITSGSQSSVADDFLHLASDAVRDAQASEGALRSAISRAYYAVFLTVRDQLFGLDAISLSNKERKDLERKFRKAHSRAPGSHDLVIFALADVQPNKTVHPLTLQQQVRQLKEARVHADYHFTAGTLKGVAKQSWREYAEECVIIASQLLPTTRRLPRH